MELIKYRKDGQEFEAEVIDIDKKGQLLVKTIYADGSKSFAHPLDSDLILD